MKPPQKPRRFLAVSELTAFESNVSYAACIKDVEPSSFWATGSNASSHIVRVEVFAIDCPERILQRWGKAKWPIEVRNAFRILCIDESLPTHALIDHWLEVQFTHEFDEDRIQLQPLKILGAFQKADYAIRAEPLVDEDYVPTSWLKSLGTYPSIRTWRNLLDRWKSEYPGLLMPRKRGQHRKINLRVLTKVLAAEGMRDELARVKNRLNIR